MQILELHKLAPHK